MSLELCFRSLERETLAGFEEAKHSDFRKVTSPKGRKMQAASKT
jgi:hypothetical protein